MQFGVYQVGQVFTFIKLRHSYASTVLHTNYSIHYVLHIPVDVDIDQQAIYVTTNIYTRGIQHQGLTCRYNIVQIVSHTRVIRCTHPKTHVAYIRIS
jgi:hypothetical protein